MGDFGITVVKQEAEDTSFNDNKNIFGSLHPMLYIEHEVDPLAFSPGISVDFQHNTGHLKLESNINVDKVLPVATLYENDCSKQGCGLPSVSGRTRICLKKEVNLDCQNEMPVHIYVFTENDVVKQEDFHGGKRCFECVICKKSFTKSGNLSRHHRTHTGEKPFECDVCEKTFHRKADLSSHERTHSGEKIFECKVCEKRFPYSSSLSYHQKTHTGERPFKCYICEKGFRKNSSLSSHKRTHTGEKPYECDACEKRFTSSNSLSHHKKTHIGEKSFERDKCEKRFTLKSSLFYHQKTHT